MVIAFCVYVYKSIDPIITSDMVKTSCANYITSIINSTSGYSNNKENLEFMMIHLKEYDDDSSYGLPEYCHNNNIKYRW